MQHQAQARCLAERLQLVLHDDHDAIAQSRQPLLRHGRGPRRVGPYLLGDVGFRRDLFRQVLVHVVDQARHEGAHPGKQREQLGVVHVKHVWPQGAQRLSDLDGVEEACLAATCRQRRDQHAPVIAMTLGAGRQVGHLIAGLAERPALALIDAGVVGGVDHGHVGDTDLHVCSSLTVRSSQRRTTWPAEPTQAPSAVARSTSRQYSSS